MTVRRIYAATTGQCLVRNTDDVDEEERSRVTRDFEAGVRLVVDSDHQEVRGFVPAMRSTSEALFAVTQFDHESNASPLDTLSAAVTEEFEKRPHWRLREDTPEGAFIRQLADPSSETTFPEGLQELLDADPSDDTPVTVAVGDFTAAANVVRAIEQLQARGHTPRRTVVVAVYESVDHINYDVLCLVREQTSGVSVIDDATGESGETRKTETRAESPVLDEPSTPRRLLDTLRCLFGRD
ncbi:hypothetical protein [Salinigranum halophilum]|uniref:hypothetical protein n=1 Tax=Salinigranum halophilum TaxID=2565931 RepID=UPI00115EAF38|nr:hypothetical protein [Salinigranum halophilum]